MASPHKIRLHGPWHLYPAGNEEPQRIRLPDDWEPTVLDFAAGISLLERWFHSPTGLHAGTQVELVLVNLPLGGDVELNGAVLGGFEADAECRYLIQDRLVTRNCLRLRMKADGKASRRGPLSSTRSREVFLLIHPTA